MRAKAAYLYNDISTIGYESLILTWIDYRSFLNNGNSGTMNGNPVKLYYSVNKGANYIEVTGLNEAITFNKWVQKSVKLPIACNNVQDIRLVWVISNDNKHGDYYAIDDITLTGTPEEGISTLDWNKVAKNEDPFAAGKSYTVDGKVVFLISQFQQALSYRHA
ncbi:hypothetical protein C8E01_10727 [Pontibacter virosus]|uniref:Uncharacterized protein n=2 Tax=Pontibacter virosus TaxID=1765052 RepID=A0A2U1AVD9_9BACT|nr:hypothetical protein C8E01_10727 [Pontibacter virosus]